MLEKIASSFSQADAFDYLADFSNARFWDPSVTAAERLGGGEPGLGSTFRIVTVFAGISTELVYETVLYERPCRVGFRAETTWAVSRDEIGFVRAGDGSQVIYDARLDAKWLLGWADPLLQVLFSRLAVGSARGLREALA